MDHLGWDIDEDLDFVELADEPPLGFDCGREEQNTFLYDHALADARAQLSGTYLALLKGVFVGYVTLTMDSLELYAHERPEGARYREVPAVKICQLAVHQEFHGREIGPTLVAFSVVVATALARPVGCRFITVDAKADVVAWYERMGFVVNKLREKDRDKRAADANRERSVDHPVSMRLDIRDNPLEQLVERLRAH